MAKRRDPLLRALGAEEREVRQQERVGEDVNVLAVQVIELAAVSIGTRTALERRARRLAWGGNVWHLVEFGAAVGAGVSASSIALIGFGADSLVEVFSGLVVVWLFTGTRRGSTNPSSSMRAGRLAKRKSAPTPRAPRL